jgi:hypothetical protein
MSRAEIGFFLFGIFCSAACVAADGTLLYTRRSGTPERFTSLSKWAKEVALLKGLTKHYSGWFCILDRLQRPLEHLRQKYWHEKQGIPFTLPSMDKKRRRDESALDIEPRKILASTDEGISQYESIPTAQFDLGGRQSVRPVPSVFRPLCSLYAGRCRLDLPFVAPHSKGAPGNFSHLLSH